MVNQIEKIIWLETTRFSKVVKAFLEEYPNAIIKLDKRLVRDPINVWCTNARLKGAIDFALINENEKILSFHDGPWNMWASMTTLSLVESLAIQKILRYHISKTVRRKNIIFRLLSIFNR